MRVREREGNNYYNVIRVTIKIDSKNATELNGMEEKFYEIKE